MRLIRILYIQAVLTGMALCVVWQGSLTRQAGYRQELLRRGIQSCEADAQDCKAEISKLKSPHRILYLVNYLALDLTHESIVLPGTALGSPPGTEPAASEEPERVAGLTSSQ